MILEKDILRFQKFVNKNGPLHKNRKLGRCWVWTGVIAGNGYGHFWLNNSNPGAHRVSLAIKTGSIPIGKNALHKCDNRSCVNPSHLYWGTSLQNSQDMVRRGRQRKGPIPSECYLRGSAIPWSVLNESIVLKIKKLYHIDKMKPRHIAQQLNIEKSHVRRVVYECAWRHVKLG